MPNLDQILNELNIPYERIQHPPFRTCADADTWYDEENLSESEIGGRSKNLFLRNRKGNQHYLLVLQSDKALDLKAFGDQIGERLSFASPERLKKYLKVEPGAVSIFGLVHDEARHVKVYFDADLLDYEKLHYHPGVNTETLVLSAADAKKFLESTGHQVIFQSKFS